MKREVDRERKLPAFSLDLGELEALWNKMINLFENQENIYCSIDITMKSEKLTFENIQEMLSYDFNENITDFRFRFFENGHLVSIRQDCFTNRQAVACSTSESEAWCAGALETVYSFIQSYKVWYSWLVSAPIGWFILILVWIPAITVWILPDFIIRNLFIFPWLSIEVVLIFLYVFRSKLFPGAVIRTSDSESFIRRYSGEIALIISVLTFIVAIIGILISA